MIEFLFQLKVLSYLIAMGCLYVGIFVRSCEGMYVCMSITRMCQNPLSEFFRIFRNDEAFQLQLKDLRGISPKILFLRQMSSLGQIRPEFTQRYIS